MIKEKREETLFNFLKPIITMLAIGAIVIGIICWLSSKPKKKGKDILVGVVIVNTGDTLIADTIVVNLYDSFGNEFKNEAISDPGTGVR